MYPPPLSAPYVSPSPSPLLMYPPPPLRPLCIPLPLSAPYVSPSPSPPLMYPPPPLRSLCIPLPLSGPYVSPSPSPPLMYPPPPLRPLCIPLPLSGPYVSPSPSPLLYVSPSPSPLLMYPPPEIPAFVSGSQYTWLARHHLYSNQHQSYGRTACTGRTNLLFRADVALLLMTCIMLTVCWQHDSYQMPSHCSVMQLVCLSVERINCQCRQLHWACHEWQSVHARFIVPYENIWHA